jgi:glycosyltransferase involved in cell wall biosynthesis
MRVLLVNYEYPPLGGGGGILTRSLARNLAARGEVAVVTSGTKALPRIANEDGVGVVRVPVAGRTERRRASPVSLAAFVPSALAGGRRRLGSFRPDVVHTFFAIPSGPAGAALARRYGVPHVLTVIGADVHDPSRRFSPDRFAPLRAAMRRVVRSADAVVAISTDVAERTRELTGRTDIDVVPCGVDPRPLPARSRTGLGWSDDDVVIVTTARLVARKAIDVLIRAMGKLPPNARLEIVGDGPERDGLEALASTTAARITFAGDVDDAQRDLRLVSADVFCQPSLHEGFGIAIVEAMGCGLPVVATDSGGPRDFVRDGVNGFLAPPADDAALAARLAELVASADLRAAMGAEARKSADELTSASMTDLYMRTYERVRS